MYQRISASRPVQPDNAAIAKINVYISLVMRYAEIKWLQEVASDLYQTTSVVYRLLHQLQNLLPHK